MLVLAAVPDVQFHKLRRAAGSRFNVAQVSTWDDVLTSIRGRPVELAVVDPLLSGQARSQEIERLRVLFPSLPLMLYTTLTPRTAGVLLALGQRGDRKSTRLNSSHLVISYAVFCLKKKISIARQHRKHQ